MANTFLTPDVIARAALANLYENTVMAGLVHRDYDADFDGAVGNTVTVRKPAVFTADAFSRSSGIQIQDATEGSVDVTLDTILDVSFAVTDEQLSMEIEDFSEQLLNPAMEAISQGIDQRLISAFLAEHDAIAEVEVGAAADVVDVRTALSAAKVPTTQRYAVWSTTMAGLLLKDPLFHQADQRGDTEGLREASIGRKFGLDHFEDQNVDSAEVEDGGDTITAAGVAFHRSAIALATRTLPTPRGGAMAAVANYKGLGLRVVYGYDISKKQQVISVDMLCGVKVLDPDRVVLVQVKPEG